jgi:hypothetical protein
MEDIIDELSIGNEQNQALSEKAISTLESTAGWIRFSAIAGYISTIYSILKNYVGNSPITQLQTTNNLGKYTGHLITNLSLVLQVLAWGLAIIGLSSSTFLLLYAVKLSHYARYRHMPDLAHAFRNQRLYYALTGILLTSVIALFLLGTLIVMAVGKASSE